MKAGSFRKESFWQCMWWESSCQATRSLTQQWLRTVVGVGSSMSIVQSYQLWRKSSSSSYSFQPKLYLNNTPVTPTPHPTSSPLKSCSISITGKFTFVHWCDFPFRGMHVLGLEEAKHRMRWSICVLVGSFRPVRLTGGLRRTVPSFLKQFMMIIMDSDVWSQCWVYCEVLIGISCSVATNISSKGWTSLLSPAESCTSAWFSAWYLGVELSESSCVPAKSVSSDIRPEGLGKRPADSWEVEQLRKVEATKRRCWNWRLREDDPTVFAWVIRW